MCTINGNCVNSTVTSRGNPDMKLSVDCSQEIKFSLGCPEKKICSGLPVLSLGRLPLLSFIRPESIHTPGLKSDGKGPGFKIRFTSHLPDWRSEILAYLSPVSHLQTEDYHCFKSPFRRQPEITSQS